MGNIGILFYSCGIEQMNRRCIETAHSRQRNGDADNESGNAAIAQVI